MVGVEHPSLNRIIILIECYSNRAAAYQAGRNNGVINLARRVRRDGEVHAIVSPAPRGNRRIDADYLAAQISQRPAAIAGIDGRVGLEEALELVLRPASDVSSLGANDPCRDG